MTVQTREQTAHGATTFQMEHSENGDVLTVTTRILQDGVVTKEGTETFDFTGTPDGALDIDAMELEHLPWNPILSAERTDGNLTVTLLDWSTTNV